MKFGVFVGLVLTVLYLPPSCGQYNSQQAERYILKTIRNLDSYDASIRPLGVNKTGPLLVTTELLVRRIYNFDDINQEYSVQITIRNSWIDERLAYSGDESYVNLSDDEKIWTPDLFFSNEIDGQALDLLKPNVLIRVFPNGKIMYSTRISLRLSCGMNFRRYPHDTQMCNIIMPSYGHTTKEMLLTWKESNPVQVTKNITIPNQELTSFNPGYCTSRTTTGEYSCLKLEFTFKRSGSNFLIRVYIPSIMIIIVSYLHLWMSVTAISGRVLLALGSLVIMSAGSVDLSHSMPQTSYTKAIDVWTGVCLTFLFWSLVEFVVVNYLSRRSSVEELGNAEDTSLEKNVHLRRLKNLFANHPLPERIDAITRVAYPSLFLLFNMVYWAVFLQERSMEAS